MDLADLINKSLIKNALVDACKLMIWGVGKHCSMFFPQLLGQLEIVVACQLDARTSSISPYEKYSVNAMVDGGTPVLLTIGSTSLTPLSSAGLWLAVTMTPIVALRFLERRQAIMPTVNMT